MCDDEGEDEDGKEGEREDEHVEETVVPPSNAVPHPRTVVVKTLCVDRDKQSKKSLFWIQACPPTSHLFHHVAATVRYALSESLCHAHVLL